MSELNKKETIDTPYGPLLIQNTEDVRRRPGMFVGSTDGRGLHRLIWMFLKSDPYLEYRLELPASYEICLNADGSFSVKLSRPFILPEYAQDREQTSGSPTLFETMMTKMVVKGKVSELLIPNALSEWAWAAVIDRENGRIYRQDYRQGLPQGPLSESQDTVALAQFGEEWSNLFCFKPDPEIFDSDVDFSYDYLFSYTRKCALLTPGLKIGIADRRDPQLPQLNTFLFEEGKWLLLDSLNSLGLKEGLENVNPYHPKYPPIIAKGEAEGVKVYVELYLQQLTRPTLTPALFVNNENIPDYSHEVDEGLWEGLLPPLNEYARQTGLLRSSPDLSKADVAPGLIAIFNLKVGYPWLTGPGKTKFASPEAKPAVAEVLNKAVREWLEAHPAQVI